MKICMITSEFPPKCAGIGYYVYNLSKKLTEMGNKVTVLTRGNYTNSYQKIDDIDVYRIKFFPLPPFHIKLHSYFVNNFFSKIQEEFDIIHQHSPLTPTIKGDLPSIATFHSCWESESKTYDKITDTWSLYVKIFNKFFMKEEIKTLIDSKRITAVSNSVANSLSKSYGMNRKEINVVKNGVNEKLFKPSKNDKRAPCNILYTGRLIYSKGLIDLTKSAKQVIKEYPDVSFLLAGDGNLRPSLERLVKKERLEQNFSFLGFINQEKLIEHYQRDTINVLPSYIEGLPTTVLEAMACGMPVVATDVSGTNEIVVDDINGILVPPKNPEKLAGALLELLNDENLRRFMGKNGRNYIEKKFTWDNVAKDIFRSYKEAV